MWCPAPETQKQYVDKHVVGTDLEDFRNNVFRGSLSEHDSKTESRGTTTKRVIVHATHILSWVRFGYPYQIHKGSPRTDSSDFVRLRQTSSDFVRLRQRLSKDVPGAVDACFVVGPTQRFTQYKQTFGGADIRDV